MKISNSTTLTFTKKGVPVAHLYNDTYRFNMYVYFPCGLEDEVEIVRAMGYGGDLPTESSTARMYEFTSPWVGYTNLIFLRSCGPSPDEYASITHEAIHAALFQLEYKGVDITAENAEPLTYLTEWIVREVIGAINHYREMPNKPKRKTRGRGTKNADRR